MENNRTVQAPAERGGKSPFNILHRLDYLIAALIFVAVISQGLKTMHEVGISWDEPTYFYRAKGYVSWFSNLGKQDSFKGLTLSQTFGTVLLVDDQPTLIKLTGAITYSLFKGLLGEFWAYRMNAVIMFGLLLSLIYLYGSRAWGKATGITSVLCTAFMPRVFTHGCLATTEMALCLFWFIAAWMFEAGTRKRSLIPLAGVSYGLLMSVVFTGFLLPIPLIIWAFIYHRRNLAWFLLTIIVIGPFIFVALNPSIWYNPFFGICAFVKLNIERILWAHHSVLFMGKMYDKAPWYYAPYMSLVTVPIFTLVLFFWGTIRTIANGLRDEFAALCLIQFCFFIAIAMSPNAPTYDGVRLFLPAFIFMGLLAGEGFVSAVRWCMNHTRSKIFCISLHGNVLTIGAIAAMFLGLGVTFPLIRSYPYGLEYYNELIGGIGGARNHGMETTYWWTAFNEKDLARVNKLLPPNAKLRFFPDSGIYILYQEMGLLRSDVKVTTGKDFDYILILSRPYWNCSTIFRAIDVPQPHLKFIAYKMLGEVPLWVLYWAPERDGAGP